MSLIKKPGFTYYEIPYTAKTSLPEGFGITKLSKAVIGFYASYFTEDGQDSPLHEVEFVETPQGLSFNNLTLQREEEDKINLKAQIAMNKY